MSIAHSYSRTHEAGDGEAGLKRAAIHPVQPPIPNLQPHRDAGGRQSPPMGVACLHPKPPPRTRHQNRIELLQGTLDLLILQTLQWGPQHGYGIAQAIQAGSSDVLQVDTGSLYPALHRLERQKWIAATWKVSANKQRTRVYRLTAAGRRQLASERSRWQLIVDA